MIFNIKDYIYILKQVDILKLEEDDDDDDNNDNEHDNQDWYNILSNMKPCECYKILLGTIIYELIDVIND